jgi:hypothetical protein
VPLKMTKARDDVHPDLLKTPGTHCDGAGLYLQVDRVLNEEDRAERMKIAADLAAGLIDKETAKKRRKAVPGKAGGASYVFRHKNEWAGLGSASAFTLVEARKKAAEPWKAAIRKEDPFALLKTLRGGADPMGVTGKTFAEAMAIYLAAKNSNFTDSNRKREKRRYEFLFTEQLPWFCALRLPISQTDKNKAKAHFNDKSDKIRDDVGYYINAIIRYDTDGTLRGIKKKAVEHKLRLVRI